MTGILVRVVSPTFVAGFVMEAGNVSRSAPILRRHIIGKTRDELRALFARKGWTASIVSQW